MLKRLMDHRPTLPIMWHSIARGVALFFGAFTLLNLLCALWRTGFTANRWWIDLQPIPDAIATVFLCWAGVALLYFAQYPHGTIRQRQIIGCTVMLLLVATAWDTARVLRLLSAGVIHSYFPVPFSAIVFLALIPVFQAVRVPSSPTATPGRITTVAAIALLCAIAFPIMQLYCFGMADYRQHADVIVVFGAKAFRDGHPSAALADRVRTACSLYHDGYAPRLLFTGGPSAGTMHETESMRRYAMKLGCRQAPSSSTVAASTHNPRCAIPRRCFGSMASTG